jgi:hypothetical protein
MYVPPMAGSAMPHGLGSANVVYAHGNRRACPLNLYEYCHVRLHLGPANGWIGDAGVEGRDGDEHDSIHKG